MGAEAEDAAFSATCTASVTQECNSGGTDALDQAARLDTAQALLQRQTVLAPKSGPKVSKPHRVEDDDAEFADSVSLGESGYRKIAKLESASEMEHFIKRVVDELGYKISDVGSLHGVVPYYSGKKAVQSYAALKEELSRVSKKK